MTHSHPFLINWGKSKAIIYIKNQQKPNGCYPFSFPMNLGTQNVLKCKGRDSWIIIETTSASF